MLYNSVWEKDRRQDKKLSRASVFAEQGVSVMQQMLGGLGGGGPQGAAAAAAGRGDTAQSIQAGDELLAYGELRMPPPHSEKRGTLQLARRVDIYMELLLSQRIEVTFDVIAVIAAANRRAEAITQASLPPRCRVASSDRYDHAYSAQTPVEVPSDGTFHSIAVIATSAVVDVRHVVVPRMSTDVFRVAEIENPLGAPILDGPVDVYLGKDFLLTSDVEFTPPKGAMQLGLGVEQAVKVSRNTGYKEESSGLIRGSLVLKHEIRIELQNHLDSEIDCEVRERIPSIRKDEDDIEIKIGEVEPSWSPYEVELASSPEAGLKGGYYWRIRVPGQGGKSRLTAKYDIKIPAKYELVDGNRREV